MSIRCLPAIRWMARHGVVSRLTSHFTQRIAAVLLVFLASAVGIFAGPTATAVAEEKADVGRVLYLKQCASCHGKNGEGQTTDYEQPLVGDLSIQQLATYIDEAMPADDPSACTGTDAQAIAKYIHKAFYSVTARARNAPPRVELARLTNRQYRQSVADLLGSFTWDRRPDNERGLQAEYFKSRRMSRNNRVMARRDARIEIGFGSGPLTKEAQVGQFPPTGKPQPPQKGKKKPEYPEYTAMWRGSLFAPETGEYTIVLQTQNAGRVWLNDTRQELINARVRSGDQTRYAATIQLLGGRYYPLRVEYIKSKADPVGSVQLRWQPPHQVEQIIPERVLSPHQFPETFVVTTKFPPDDRSVGYERGVSVSAEWDQATTRAAIEVANAIMPRIEQIAKLKGSADEQTQQLRQFCKQFVSRAFRKPLSQAELKLYLDRQFERAGSPREATKRVILLTLKSPRFLFPQAALSLDDPHGTAGWLALALWDSLPDERLRQAAAQNQLQTREQIHREATRMAQDPRARGKLLAFLRSWFYFDHFHDLQKSTEQFPEFTAELATDLHHSADIMLSEVVDSPQADYRQLFLRTEIPMNRRIAEFYGVSDRVPQAAADSEFVSVSLEPQHRAGLLTHPYLLSGLAYEQASSPIHRGVFLTRNVLGRFLKPPPIAVAPIPVDMHPDITTRERVRIQTDQALCMNCHSVINELGFSLEHFDAVGRFRPREKGKPIDARGTYIDRAGNESTFNGAAELAKFVIRHNDARGAFTEHLFQYMTKQPIQAYGAETLPTLRDRFVVDQFNMRKLLANLVTEAVVRRRGALQAASN